MIALLDPQVFDLYPEEFKRRIKVEPPDQAASVQVAGLRAQEVDWIVVLYHGPLQEAERLARQVPGIDLIVAGTSSACRSPAWSRGDTLLVSPGEEGNRLGILTLGVTRTGTCATPTSGAGSGSTTPATRRSWRA